MGTKLGLYCNKTVIPEYLLPLPKVDFEIYRKYRKNYVSPKSLLELCCEKLEKIEWDGSCARKWNEFEEIFRLSSTIVTDTYRMLCHIQDPNSATQYVLHRSRKRSVCEFFKHLRLIHRELSGIERNRLENHWDIMANKPKFPYLLIGKITKR